MPYYCNNWMISKWQNKINPIWLIFSPLEILWTYKKKVAMMYYTSLEPEYNIETDAEV